MLSHLLLSLPLLIYRHLDEIYMIVLSFLMPNRAARFSQRLKVTTQGLRLLQLCLFGTTGAIALIFLANHQAIRPLWRLLVTEATLFSLVVLNIAWKSALRDWVFLCASSALVAAAAWISRQSDVMYILSLVCIQAYFKVKVWPKGIAFGAANLVGWIAFLIAVGSTPWTVVSKGFALAIGILFGALMVSLIQELQAANRKLEASRQKDKDLAVAEERVRLARELHDSVTQSLFAMNLYAEAAADLVSVGDIETASGHLREIRETAEEALREMRLFVFELHSPGLENAGLVGAIQARLAAVEGRGGMRADLSIEGCENVTQSVQSELYGVAREALNNALKHSKAAGVHVKLRFAEDGTRLEVSDDGRGFDSSGGQAVGGFGISGMRERVARIGGMLSIESASGRGTTIAAWVPKT
jgi:signal transduction histidine kinase